jgi:hypothetical protein
MCRAFHCPFRPQAASVRRLRLVVLHTSCTRLAAGVATAAPRGATDRSPGSGHASAASMDAAPGIEASRGSAAESLRMLPTAVMPRPQRDEPVASRRRGGSRLVSVSATCRRDDVSRARPIRSSVRVPGVAPRNAAHPGLLRTVARSAGLGLSKMCRTTRRLRRVTGANGTPRLE